MTMLKIIIYESFKFFAFIVTSVAFVFFVRYKSTLEEYSVSPLNSFNQYFILFSIFHDRNLN